MQYNKYMCWRPDVNKEVSHPALLLHQWMRFKSLGDPNTLPFMMINTYNAISEGYIKLEP